MNPKILSGKRYYSISEVANYFDVSKSLLRYWESQFRSINPNKTRSGERKYTNQTIKQIEIIYDLVKVKGFTFKGAKDELNKNRSSLKQKQEMIAKMKNVRSYLSSLKNNITEL